jgi:acyl-coenzyme A thioesterase PaaI-like protein
VTLASGVLRAEGLVVHPGSRVATAEARLEGEDGMLYAHASSTWLIYDVAEKLTKKQPIAA